MTYKNTHPFRALNKFNLQIRRVTYVHSQVDKHLLNGKI